MLVMIARPGNFRERMMAAKMVRPLKSGVFMLFFPEYGEHNQARED